MEIQAKVDANHPDGIVDTSEDRIYGVTLAQEERIRARGRARSNQCTGGIRSTRGAGGANESGS